MGKLWHRLRVRLPAHLEDEAAAWLAEAGSVGSAGAPTAPGEVLLEAWFPDGEALRTGGALLSRRLPPGIAAELRIDTVPEEPWVERYERSRGPLRLPGGFLVTPGPARVEGARGLRHLVIPPARAFGTGEHSTTRLVLQGLVREVRPGRAVLDLGTGSGLLAFAAARLGARPVLGLDNDREAIRMARENRRLNRLDSRVHLATGDARCLAQSCFALILANLFADALAEAAPVLARLQAPGGRAILSGFSGDDEGSVAAPWLRVGYRKERIEVEGEWAALTLRREG